MAIAAIAANNSRCDQFYPLCMLHLLRYLRIAFSAACLIACVLLIALWVRSYWWRDSIYRKSVDDNGGMETGVAIESGYGQLTFYDATDPYLDLRGAVGSYHHRAQRYDDEIQIPDAGIPSTFHHGFWGTRFMYEPPPSWRAAVPHWIALVNLLLIAAAPWLPWRFSLRTLLIATTLVAAVLGLVVWLVR